MSELACAHIIVSGMVQGVGFRYFAIQEATRRQLKGFVRNLYSGEVELVVEGEKGMIADFVREVKAGPSYAHISNVAVQWREYTGEYKDFRVRF